MENRIDVKTDKVRSKILIVVAHPDDEVLGCGGTIKRMSKEGNDLYIAILGEGITSRYQNRNLVNKEEIDKLKEISCEVSRLLGVKKVFQYELPDNRFDAVPLLDVIKTVEGLIEQVKPAVVFTHHVSDLNVDHQVTHRAVLTATRPIVGTMVRDIYMFEVASSTEWTFGQFKPAFCPNVFYDISETLNNKIEALKLYKNEIKDFPHPRSPKAIIAIAEKWGSTVGVKAAEAFELIRSVR